jgi:hypothetical protein
MRALIDLTVPFANIYYSTYLTEPSPAGDITIASDGIATVEHMSLERLLTEMKDVGPKGELLVATHSATGAPDTVQPPFSRRIQVHTLPDGSSPSRARPPPQ